MKPLIGIPAHPTLFERNHSIIQSCGQNYIESVEKAGGIVLILPITADEEAIRRQAEMCDAYLIPGGIDVNPLSYGENPHPLLQMTRLEYDEYEISLIREITKTGKPVLGICNGMQMINIYFGGDLIQDIPSKQRHQRNSGKDSWHGARAAEGSWIRTLYPETFSVNSSHHQAVGKTGEGVVPVLYSDDHVVEGICVQGRPVYGLQWHPERICGPQEEHPDAADGTRVYEFFLDICRQ